MGIAVLSCVNTKAHHRTLTLARSLHNLNKISSSAPLIIYLPPYGSEQDESVAPLPPFCNPYATAVVNYRWAGFNPFREPEPPSPDTDGATGDYRPIAPLLTWPTPITDVMRAYDWLFQNLAPPESQKRDVYVLGSYLGAPLAASLAISESKPSMPMAVRGFAAYNGIYNWTMFLRDHPILTEPYDPKDPANDPVFQEIALHTESLFDKPANLFDPFASPCLFLHTPGLQAAPDFHTSIDTVWYSLSPEQQKEFWNEEPEEGEDPKFAEDFVPRKTSIKWPPRDSGLELPHCLLLHSCEPRRTVPTTPTHHYQFQYQANNLADHIRRGFSHSPLYHKSRWETTESYERFLGDCFRTRNVGADTRTYTLPAAAERAIGAWLKYQITTPPKPPAKPSPEEIDAADAGTNQNGKAVTRMKNRGKKGRYGN